MYEEDVVLCGSSAYEKKFYINDVFSNLPDEVKKELQIMCVLFTEDAGGVLLLKFDKDGNLNFVTECDENDILYDEISSGLLISKLRRDKRELLEGLETYYKVMLLNNSQNNS